MLEPVKIIRTIISQIKVLAIINQTMTGITTIIKIITLTHKTATGIAKTHKIMAGMPINF